MKKNMRKVPLIQEKSDLYHQVEEQEADHIIQTIDHNHEHEQHREQKDKQEKKSWLQQLKIRLLSLRKLFYS
jgi:hypothetical protein